MERPRMDAACVNRCVKGGKTRSACMKTCYPEGNGKGRGNGKKKAPPKRSSRY